MSKAHHPLSTEIVTVLSHHVIRKCWSMEGQAAGNKEEMVQQKAGDKTGSDQATHQSGSGKEDEEDEEEKEGELENRGMEEAGWELWGNDGAEVVIAFHGIHTNLDTWIIHHS